MEFRRRRPSPASLRWVEASLGGGARVVAIRRLFGGLGSAVHRVTVERRSGERSVVVLRQYEKVGEEAPIEREAFALEAVATSDVPAPRVLACDAAGVATDERPTLLMSREPGRVFLTPTDERAWVAQMAHVLAAIHDLRIDAPPFERWKDLVDRPVPTSASDPQLWLDVFEVLSEPAPVLPSGFLHRDFQHFNMLWSRERLRAVIDWTWVSTGPPEVDTGHCRLNLAVLFSAELADTFLAAYEAEVGRRLDPWWDLQSVSGYSDAWQEFIPIQVAGRRAVDAAGMAGRVEQVMRSLLAQL